jgi:thymidylate kinase
VKTLLEGHSTHVLITFSGLDGAGKSTLIEFLSTIFERAQRPVVVLHLNDEVGVYAFLRLLRDRLLGRSQRQLAPGVADPRSQKTRRPVPQGMRGVVTRWRTAIIWNKPIRRLLYLVDLVIFSCYRAYLERFRGHVVIMDRYFYDTLVDVSNGSNRLWTRLLERLTPAPTVPVFLDISPEESFRRKGEFSVEYLRRRSDAYHHVFQRVPGAVRIVNNDLDATKATLLRVVNDRNGAS